MTGESALGSGDAAVNFTFDLHCDVDQATHTLVVNFIEEAGATYHVALLAPEHEVNFELEELTSAVCSDDPDVGNPAEVNFDTYQGSGTGRYENLSGASAEWTFVDAGEDGADDTAEILVKGANGAVVLHSRGKLSGGNHQAHGED
jgi:hypothetical protein